MFDPGCTVVINIDIPAYAKASAGKPATKKGTIWHLVTSGRIYSLSGK